MQSAALDGGMSGSESSSRMTISAESTTATSTTPASRQSTMELRASASQKRSSTGGRSSSSSLSDTKQREMRQELRRRKSWQNEDAGDDEEETKETSLPEDEGADASEPQPSPSYYASSYRSGVYATATTSQPFNEQTEGTQRPRKSSMESAAPEEEAEDVYQPFHYEESRYSDEDENVEAFEADVPKRSIARFAPMHQSIFDDSDEEFLMEIRRPRSPVALASSRTFTSFGDEQMDVERTISAAFGGRPHGGGASTAVSTYYQPVAPAPAPAPVSAPVSAPASSQRNTTGQARQDLIHMYSQQRRQLVTGRRESSANEETAQPSGVAARSSSSSSSSNYQQVFRDRTPRITRRIAFDEEMMALAATPEPRAYAAMAAPAAAAFTPAGEKRKHSVIFSPEDEAPDFSRRRTRL